MAETLPPLPNPGANSDPSEMYRYNARLRSYIVALEKRLKALEDA